MAANQYDVYLVNGNPKITAREVDTKALGLEDTAVLTEAQKVFSTKSFKDGIGTYEFNDDFGNELKLIAEKRVVEEMILRIGFKFGEEAVDRAYLIASNLCERFGLRIFEPYTRSFVKSKGELYTKLNKERLKRLNRLGLLSE